jgi:hypothetical protein
LSDLSLTIEGPFRGVQCLTLADVQSVTVRGEGFPNSLLNIGTIVVQAAGSVEQLTDVDRPYRVCAAILERVKAIRDRERSGERT